MSKFGEIVGVRGDGGGGVPNAGLIGLTVGGGDGGVVGVPDGLKTSSSANEKNKQKTKNIRE